MLNVDTLYLDAVTTLVDSGAYGDHTRCIVAISDGVTTEYIASDELLATEMGFMDPFHNVRTRLSQMQAMMTRGDYDCYGEPVFYPL